MFTNGSALLLSILGLIKAFLRSWRKKKEKNVKHLLSFVRHCIPGAVVRKAPSKSGRINATFGSFSFFFPNDLINMLSYCIKYCPQPLLYHHC
jgi:hypothetical protein